LGNGYEVQDIITESGELGLQAKKSGWIRKCSGTSYAIQLVVKQCSDSRYVVTAGWGEWLAKGTVVFVATFIAFGFLLIPALVGIVNQKNLPDKCLSHVADTISRRHALCKVFSDAF